MFRLQIKGKPQTCFSNFKTSAFSGISCYSCLIFLHCWIPQVNLHACMHARWLQSCPTLCHHMDYSLPVSSVPGILLARILEWVALPSSGGASRPSNETCVSYVFYIGRQVLSPLAPPGKLQNMCAATAAKSLQSCPTLCDPVEGSPPGSPVPGILQERTLEWVAISFSNA